MTVIDGEFCLRMGADHTHSRVSGVTLECSEIIGSYNVPATAVKDRRQK